MANHYSADQWRVWFLEYESSGLTVTRFCDSIGVAVQTFYKWRRKLRSESEFDQRRSVGSEFVSVVMPASQLEIEFPNGAIVRVANDTNSIRPLFEVLLELGAKQ